MIEPTDIEKPTIGIEGLDLNFGTLALERHDNGHSIWVLAKNAQKAPPGTRLSRIDGWYCVYSTASGNNAATLPLFNGYEALNQGYWTIFTIPETPASPEGH